MKTITRKQKNVLDFIDNYTQENGISPTIEEIRKRLKLKAVSTIHEHINSLKSKGYLSKSNNSARSLILKKEIRPVIEIPILGSIKAGYPLPAIEERDGSVSVINPQIRSSEGYYALRVVGDSMIDDGIFDGDIVIIKNQSVAENGQTVVAIIDDNEATLKKLYRKGKGFNLEPRNPNMPTLFRTDVEVRGIVVQVISNITNKPEKSVAKKTKHGFKTIDLFAGVGGIRLGFENAGFKTVFANDFDEPCRQTYDLNFKDSKLVVEDLNVLGIDDLPKFDFLLAGFPCQPFSIAGYRKGFDDEKGRGNLFNKLAEILEERKPEGFLLENVKNLKSHDGGNTFKVIEERLKEMGYFVKSKILNSMEYGNIPQNRERIYIVGFKNKDYSEKFEFPHPIKLTKKITDILEKNVPEKYYYNGKPLFEKLKKDIKEEGKVYQWRRQYVRENKSGVCPTLTANMGMGGHNVPIIKDKIGIRKLTPLECFRIQGFPKDYILPKISDSALYKQAGNSVSVPVVEAVAKQMMKAME
ncbi:MAG: transcriptional repressor LexA [Patescibacteria group bacterium]